MSVLYDAVRHALANLDKIERGTIPEQRAIVAEARANLHRAEDVLRDPYWHGGLE